MADISGSGSARSSIEKNSGYCTIRIKGPEALGSPHRPSIISRRHADKISCPLRKTSRHGNFLAALTSEMIPNDGQGDPKASGPFY